MSAIGSKCKYFEIMQYQCDLTGKKIVCVPFARIFKRCVGRPTIEVTPIYDTNGDPATSALPIDDRLKFKFKYRSES
ncbi:9402_t:CDS:2 [Paraglomus occultum]|uniref:9402_t:CDS:1 n=1 Tax=Paraglomus occultum TaxID=144539 RepID=A0A9N8YXB2_9GLOM|nr:9402_t:CDS:2 [Paraglomus occultum]